jgi:cytidine deaminase
MACAQPISSTSLTPALDTSAALAQLSTASPPEHILALALALKDELDPPHQSNFRVYCVMTYADDAETGDSSTSASPSADARPLRAMTGTNCEACGIHASFCAERTALVTLRNRANGFALLRAVRGLYLVCDGLSEITPGLLCREMLSSFIPMTTPIWLGARRADGSLAVRVVALGALLPFPHAYRGLRAHAIQLQFAAHRAEFSSARMLDDLYSESSSPSVAASTDGSASAAITPSPAPAAVPRDVLTRLVAAVEAVIDRDAQPWHFARIAAGVAFDDGSLFVAHQDKGLEYGTSVPAETKIFVELQRRRDAARSSSSASSSAPLPLPVCLLVIDHLGVWHAPCGQARALLSEFGYAHVAVAAWCDRRRACAWTNIGDLAPETPRCDALTQLARATAD